MMQYPDYTDAYLRLTAIAKARNNVSISTELVAIFPIIPVQNILILSFTLYVLNILLLFLITDF